MHLSTVYHINYSAQLHAVPIITNITPIIMPALSNNMNRLIVGYAHTIAHLPMAVAAAHGEPRAH